MLIHNYHFFIINTLHLQVNYKTTKKIHMLLACLRGSYKKKKKLLETFLFEDRFC